MLSLSLYDNDEKFEPLFPYGGGGGIREGLIFWYFLNNVIIARHPQFKFQVPSAITQQNVNIRTGPPL